MYVPSIGRGGLGSSSQAATGDGEEDEEADDDDDMDKRHDELGPSQLHDAHRLILHRLQELGDAVCVTLTLQVRVLSVTRVRVRLEGCEGYGRC